MTRFSAYDFTGQNQGVIQGELLPPDSGDESDSKFILAILRIQFLALVELYLFPCWLSAGALGVLDWRR